MNSTISIEIPPSIKNLLNANAFQSYGTSRRDNSARQPLEDLSLSEMFPNGISDKTLAKCCLSGLWLLHNYFNDSHTISQDIHTPEGSFWHAIMHRLEGDFSNSKYWYRKAGTHPVFQEISNAVGGDWEPDRFVDRCQQENRAGKLSDETKQVSLTEWIALFEYCYRNAKL